MKLSSVGSRIITTHPSNGITVHIDHPFLGWTVEPMETLVCKEPIKVMSINIVILEILVLHMKNHFITSFAYNLCLL